MIEISISVFECEIQSYRRWRIQKLQEFSNKISKNATEITNKIKISF